MERKQSWYNVLFVICVVLLINSIPFALFIKDPLLLNVLEISKRVAALVTFVILSKKENVTNFRGHLTNYSAGMRV